MLWLRTDGDTDWHRNLLAHAECRVVLDDRELAARHEPGEAVEADLRRLVELWRAKYGPIWVPDWFVERGRVPVKIRLTDAAAGAF